MEMVEGLPTNRYVEYCMWRIRQMRDAGIEPILVFDGGRLPNKGDEERGRQLARSEAKAKARALRKSGDHAAALDQYRRAVDVTPWHAKQLADAASEAGVFFLVAPYEADAQMAHLAMTGRVDLVISEDSDMLAYGCPAVLFKLDRDGTADLVRLDDLERNAPMSFKGWNHAMFRQMCVMSGCDFLPSLPGIGVKKAHAAIRRSRCFVKAVRALRWDGAQVPADYLARFERALWTFEHQLIFCPGTGRAVHLKPLPEGGLIAASIIQEAAKLHTDCHDFLGPALEDAVAKGIAHGHLDPITKEPFRPPVNLQTPLPGMMPPAGAPGGRPSPAGAAHAPAPPAGSSQLRGLFMPGRRAGGSRSGEGTRKAPAPAPSPDQPTLLAILQRGLTAGALHLPASKAAASSKLSPHFPRRPEAAGEKTSLPRKGDPAPRTSSQKPTLEPGAPQPPESPETRAYSTPPEPAIAAEPGAQAAVLTSRPHRRPSLSFGPVAVGSQASQASQANQLSGAPSQEDAEEREGKHVECLPNELGSPVGGCPGEATALAAAAPFDIYRAPLGAAPPDGSPPKPACLKLPPSGRTFRPPRTSGVNACDGGAAGHSEVVVIESSGDEEERGERRETSPGPRQNEDPNPIPPRHSLEELMAASRTLRPKRPRPATHGAVRATRLAAAPKTASGLAKFRFAARCD